MTRGRVGPVGAGEYLLHGIDLPALGYECIEHLPSADATHVVLARRGRI
jgi:hypothetical protein